MFYELLHLRVLTHCTSGTWSCGHEYHKLYAGIETSTFNSLECYSSRILTFVPAVMLWRARKAQFLFPDLNYQATEREKNIRKERKDAEHSCMRTHARTHACEYISRSTHTATPWVRTYIQRLQEGRQEEDIRLRSRKSDKSDAFMYYTSTRTVRHRNDRHKKGRSLGSSACFLNGFSIQCNVCSEVRCSQKCVSTEQLD